MFYSNEHEPVHVHVTIEGREAVINVINLTVIKNFGLSPRELRLALMATEENREVILERWTECFKK